MRLMTSNYLQMFLDSYHFSECSFHVHIMACQLLSANPLPETIFTYCQLEPCELISVKFESKSKNFSSKGCIVA